jgi:hypothetical protein
LIDPLRALQPAASAEHRHRQGLWLWQSVKSSKLVREMRGQGTAVHAGGLVSFAQEKRPQPRGTSWGRGDCAP